MAEIQAIGGHGISFIKPWADKELFEKIQKVRDTGADIMGIDIDIDATGLITLKQMGRPVFPRGIKKLREIIQRSSMKFILKGVMTRVDEQIKKKE